MLSVGVTLGTCGVSHTSDFLALNEEQPRERGWVELKYDKIELDYESLPFEGLMRNVLIYLCGCESMKHKNS
jgi:hypothetical protein